MDEVLKRIEAELTNLTRLREDVRARYKAAKAQGHEAEAWKLESELADLKARARALNDQYSARYAEWVREREPGQSLRPEGLQSDEAFGALGGR